MCFQLVGVRSESIGTAFGAAALAVDDFGHTVAQMGLPDVGGRIDVFGREDVVDRVGAMQCTVSRRTLGARARKSLRP